MRVPPTGYPDGSLWKSVGIDPVRIVFADQEYLSLRCYLGDRPVFLGDGDQAYVFTSARGLSRYLADNDDDTLALARAMVSSTPRCTAGM